MAFVANNVRKAKQNLSGQIQFNTGQVPSKKVDQTVSHGTIQEAIVRFNDLQDVSFEVKHKEIPNDRRSRGEMPSYLETPCSTVKEQDIKLLDVLKDDPTESGFTNTEPSRDNFISEKLSEDTHI